MTKDGGHPKSNNTLAPTGHALEQATVWSKLYVQIELKQRLVSQRSMNRSG